VLLRHRLGHAGLVEARTRYDWTAVSRQLEDLYIAGETYNARRLGLNHKWLFLIGTGIAFPLGVFPEILQGQQRITTTNNVSMVSMVTNFAAVMAFIVFKFSFLTLVVLALLCILLPYFGAAWLALRHMPEVRHQLSLFSPTAAHLHAKGDTAALRQMLVHGLLWGWAAKEAAMSRWALFRRVVLPAWLGCLPMVVVALALRLQPWWVSGGTTFLVLSEGAVVGAAGLLGLWFITLSPSEQSTITTRFRRRRPQAAISNA